MPFPSTTTTTSAQILHHTAAFLAETLSQPRLRRRLLSTFLKTLPTLLLNPLTLASQSIENAVSTTSPSLRASSLRLAENLLLSNPTNHPFSSFLLSLLYHLSHRPLLASLSLLDVFEAEPSLSRLEIAPLVFQELFLIHFGQLVEWHHMQRSKILSNNFDDDYRSSSSSILLSEMSGGQASALKDLERDYEVLLEDNCRIFVQYFKQLLQNQIISPPTILLFHKGEETTDHDRQPFYKSDEDNIKNQRFDFESPNRRYNPIWSEEERCNIESNGSRSSKSLTSFPSLFPVRVSPTLLLNNHISSKQSQNFNHVAASHQQKEYIKKVTLLDSSSTNMQNHTQLAAERSDDSMEDDDDVGSGKPPKDFVCPITTHVFDDPVTLETGQTYEREAIQEWLERGNSTCPITRHKLLSPHLPNTNYVLKRLIATWRDEHNNHQLQPMTNPRSVSPKSVIISHATIDAAMTDLRLAITHLCTSEILMEAETAVLTIERCWRERGREMELLSMLAKAPVVNGFVEMLLNSVDAQVLRATVFLLSELGSRDDTVVQTLTRVDSDVESIVHLFKKGLLEAVVLVYLLNPSTTSLVEMELADSLLEMLNGNEDLKMKMFMEPKTAALLLLARILREASASTSSSSSVAGIVASIVSTEAIGGIVGRLEAEQAEERVAAVSILLRCIVLDGKCRNIVADKARLASLLEILPQVSEAECLEIIHFFSELIKLNRRSSNEQILHTLKDEATFSIMHTLLIYLQQNDPSPVVAGLLLQLDLLEEPRKMSIYREEAMDTLISCLRNSESPSAQISAAETILSLQGRFSYSGKSLSRAILLKRAGFERSYVAFMRRDQRRHNISANSQDEDEKEGEEWERKVGFFLVSHEFGLVFEGLAQGLKSKDEELNSVCFMAATWLVYMLSVLPDTGLRGAARVCLLNHLLTVFKSDEQSIEDRALSMLGLNTFIRDPEGLQDLAEHMKDILKGLRELKKSCAMAFEMLKVLSEEHHNSSDIWSHKELSKQDCSNNGEVVALTCFKGKLLSGHSDGTIKVWNARGPELCLIQEIREHTKAVTSLTVLQSSEKLYSGSLDRTIRIWSVTEEGIYCEQVEEVKDQINNLVVANNIACFIPQGGGVKVHSWNGSSSKLVNQHKYAKCLALVQGKLYCGCHDNSIQEIDLVTGTLGNIQTGSKKLIGKVNPIYALQVHDGLLYTAAPSFDGANVKIWSTSNYSLVGSLASTLDIRTMAVSSELVYLGSKSGVVEVWCKKKHNKVETLQTSLSTKILCMAIDTNQDMLVIGTSDGRIQTWGLG